MENVIVDASTGDVGVSSMIKSAMPELHAGSILRSAHTAMRSSSELSRNFHGTFAPSTEGRQRWPLWMSVNTFWTTCLGTNGFCGAPHVVNPSRNPSLNTSNK